MRISYFIFTLLIAASLSSTSFAQDFTLHSAELQEGKQLTTAHVFKGFGCEGDNRSPQLSWSNAPEGTKSFALTVYDPDAPTGSGWWLIAATARIKSERLDSSAAWALIHCVRWASIACLFSSRSFTCLVCWYNLICCANRARSKYSDQ